MGSNDLKYGWQGTLILCLMILIAICLWPIETYHSWRKKHDS
jgi:hypothetical protein